MKLEGETCGPVTAYECHDRHLLAQHHRGVTRLEASAVDIVRVRFSPNGRFTPARPWDVIDTHDGPALQVRETPDDIVVESGQLRVHIVRSSGALRFSTADGEPFGHDLGGPAWREIAMDETALEAMPEPQLPQGRGRLGLFLNKGMAPDEGYFGFGQRTGKLDRRHRRLTNWTVDRAYPGHSRGHDNLYQAHPVFMAVRPSLTWGLFLHSTWYSSFDVGAAEDDVLTLFTLGGELDYFLFAGPTPAAVVEQLTRLTGRPTLPPLWALGYHQSRWSYGTDAQVQGIVQGFRERHIPLDAIHLDIDYMEGFRVFTWDPLRFPAPERMLADLHQQGIRAVTIVDPGVSKELDGVYELAAEGVGRDYFIRRADGSLFSGYAWPGHCLFPDFCRPAVRAWWGEAHTALLQPGVDGIWCDMNEPSVVDRPLPSFEARDQPIPLTAVQGEGRHRALHAEVHNLYGLLMARASFEGMLALRPERRPWVLTRSAYTGAQRYAVTWMGDNSAWWEHLEMSLPQLTSMGLCGMSHVGVDVGGFYDNGFGELFARWMELGTFYPFMRCHTHHATRPQEPWSFGPEVEAVATAAIELRYRLLPYLYTLAHLAHRSGAPLLRPLLYDFPDRPELYHVEDQAMVGPLLMVAPVYRPGCERRLVELPPATWYDFWTGERLASGSRVQAAPLGRIPLFVRGGSVLTLGNVRQSTAEALTDLFLYVFPGEGRWTLIEDDGESLAYTAGGIAETDLTVTEREGQLTLTIGARRGAFVPHPRSLHVHLHLGEQPAHITRDGAGIPWCWNEPQGTVELSWQDDGLAHRLEIRR